MRGLLDLSRFDIWADLDGQNSNVLITRYIRDAKVDGLLARIDSNGNAYWTLSERQGTIQTVTDGSGVVKDAITYDGWGQITNDTNSTFRGRYGYTGREEDVETGLQYNRARYFDPVVGRWITQDPLGFRAGDSNLYRYSQNSPTQHEDPSGLWWPVVGSTQWGTFFIFQIADDGPPTYIVPTNIYFNPNAKKVDATQIAFVQICRILDAKGEPDLDAVTAVQYARMTKDGWIVDMLNGRPSGWYNLGGKGGKPDPNLGNIGNSNTVASLHDAPEWSRCNVTFQFESYAIAMTGKQAGQVYGGVGWGFSVDGKQHVTIAPPRLLDKQSAAFKAAVQLWNAQADPKFKGPRNAINQQVLPAFRD